MVFTCLITESEISSYLHLLEQMPSIRQTVLKHVDDRRNVRHNDPLLGKGKCNIT